MATAVLTETLENLQYLMQLIPKSPIQHGPTGSSRAASDLRPLVTRHMKLFVNLLLVTISSFIFFSPKDLKSHASYLICCFTYSDTHATDFKTLP
jgi:hypothetical protein